MKLAISTSSMRRMAWKALSSCSPDSSSMWRDLLASRAAQRVDALAVGFEQPRHRVLRQPVHLQVGVQLAQLARDGDVAAAVAEADRRRQIERLSWPATRVSLQRAALAGAGMPSLRSRKSLIRSLHLAGKRPSGLCPPPGMVTSSAPVSSATACAAGVGLDAVVVAVDHQHGAADLAIHGFADVERRRNRPRLHGLGQHRPRGLAGPFDAVLDLLGRMRLGEDVAHEVLGEIRIVRQPVVAVVLVPALEPLALGQ